MRIKKMDRTKMVVVAVAVMCLAGAGIGVVSAATDNQSNPMSELVSAIASKFNLNTGDVQAVFDEQKTKMEAGRKAMMAQMETKRSQEFSEVLAKAVTAGKLTQAQADLITAKKAEIDAARKDLEGKTAQERMTAMQAQEKTLKQWLTDNNIPAVYLGLGQGFGRGVMGTVSAVSGNTITVTAKQMKNGLGKTYTVDASAAMIKKVAKGADSNGVPAEGTISVGDIAVGDMIAVQGTVSGANIDAVIIRDGQAGGRGMGGGGSGHGRGLLKSI